MNAIATQADTEALPHYVPLAVFAARREHFLISLRGTCTKDWILDDLFTRLPLAEYGWDRKTATVRNAGRGLWRIERY